MSIKDVLVQGGYSEEDIHLSSILIQRANNTYYNLVYNVLTCETCKAGTKKTPIMGTGPVNSPLMVIGDKPKAEEHEIGIPFSDPSGYLLTMILAKAGVDRNAIYTTYALKHHEYGTEVNEDNIEHGYSHLIQEIEAVNPQVILTTGKIAASLFSGTEKVQSLRGKPHTYQIDTQTNTKEIQIIHTFNPDKLITTEGDKRKRYKSHIWQDVQLAVKTAKDIKPNYVYDRVQLQHIGG